MIAIAKYIFCFKIFFFGSKQTTTQDLNRECKRKMIFNYRRTIYKTGVGAIILLQLWNCMQTRYLTIVLFRHGKLEYWTLCNIDPVMDEFWQKLFFSNIWMISTKSLIKLCLIASKSSRTNQIVQCCHENSFR